jgi:hypothetical protein
MGTTYLKLNPIPGKWYVSERFPTSKKRFQLLDATKPEPKRLTTEMILAGPFDTQELAKSWNSLAKASGYIWEKERIAE